MSLFLFQQTSLFVRLLLFLKIPIPVIRDRCRCKIEIIFFTNQKIFFLGSVKQEQQLVPTGI
jgi:hypothetical protein